MDKVRVVYKLDKSVSIIHPAPKSKRKDETEEEWLERVFNKAQQGELKGLPYDDIDDSELPQSREDRNAWEGEKGRGVYINREKADQLTVEKSNNEMINKRIRSSVIDELKAEGELPSDYKDIQ